jgi:hypothetical protein
LAEYEAGLNSLGIPIDEATSRDADPNNWNGTHYYKGEAVLDHSLLAESRWRASLPKDDPNRDARIVRVRRIERR